MIMTSIIAIEDYKKYEAFGKPEQDEQIVKECPISGWGGLPEHQ